MKKVSKEKLDMGKEIKVGGLTRQKYISSKRDGKAIKEDYILSFYFSN